jgi:hypothetical protein
MHHTNLSSMRFFCNCGTIKCYEYIHHEGMVSVSAQNPQINLFVTFCYIKILVIFKKYYPKIQYIWLIKINNFMNTISEILQITSGKPSVKSICQCLKSTERLQYISHSSVTCPGTYTLKKLTQLQADLKFTTRIITTKIRIQREKLTLTFQVNAEPRRLMLLLCIHCQFTSQPRNHLQTFDLHNMLWFF